MALEGTLRDFSLADIFQLIGLQRKTGVLTLKGKDDVVTVSFLDGKVVSADSLQRKVENRLGRMLVKTGRIESTTLEKALELQRQTLQRLGTILVENQMIEQDELKNALQTQILQTIYSLFRWNDGDYQFSQETSIEYDRDYVTPVQAESILMEGARMMDEWPIIERRIRSYDMVFRKVPVRQAVEVAGAEEDLDEVDFGFGDEEPSSSTVASEASESIKISEAENFVYQLLDGSTSVGEIVDRSRYNEFETVKAVYELLSRGLIEEVTEQAEEATPGEVTHMGAPQQTGSRMLGLVVAAAVVVMAGVGILAMSRNPANLALVEDQEQRIQNVVRRAVSLGRVERIGTALEAAMLLGGGYPENLDAVERLGLLAGVDTVDPWGLPYRYELQNDKIYVVGFRVDGRTDSRLVISRAIVSDRALPLGQGQPSGPSIVLRD